MVLIPPRLTHAADDPRFPFTVTATQGAAYFQIGDQIAITKVFGTAKEFNPGNTYEIQGKYRLISHATANIQVAVPAANGNSPVLSEHQSIAVQRGTGDFTLILPYANAGQPRIVFTSDSLGNDFGKLNVIAGEFPYTVEVKNLVPRLQIGDDVTLSEVRCTSATLAAGAMLQIKGVYNLASAWQARVFVEPAKNLAANQDDSNRSVQIDQGRGKFTIVVPFAAMKSHLIVSPTSGGAIDDLGFELGRSAFGRSSQPTFQEVSDVPDRPLFNLSFDANIIVGSDGTVQNPQSQQLPDFRYKVPFEPGVSCFEPGDNIGISSVRGTATTIQVGGWYLIQGNYTLAGASQAYIATWVTADQYASTGSATGIPQQEKLINRGSGSYTLVLPVQVPGWPHVAFYPAPNGGSDFGTIYFGTGDTVLRNWSWSNPPEDLMFDTGVAISRIVGETSQNSASRYH
jgi:hypothetical protein